MRHVKACCDGGELSSADWLCSQPDCGLLHSDHSHPGRLSEDGLPKVDHVGSIPAPGANHLSAIAVVLGARNEARLRRLASALVRDNIAHVAIIEPDGYLAGQMTAIGLVPCERSPELDKLLHDYRLLPNLSLNFVSDLVGDCTRDAGHVGPCNGLITPWCG